jgi:hypothetical protein
MLIKVIEGKNLSKKNQVTIKEEFIWRESIMKRKMS